MPEENNEAGAAPAPAEAPVAAVEEHIEEAATGATEVATATGVDGWQVVADELRGLRKDIKGLIKVTAGAAKEAAAPAASPSAAAGAPAVNVTVPDPPTRKIRRGARKVTRRG